MTPLAISPPRSTPEPDISSIPQDAATVPNSDTPQALTGTQPQVLLDQGVSRSHGRTARCHSQMLGELMKMGCLQISPVTSDKEQSYPARLYFDCRVSSLVEMSVPFLLKCEHKNPWMLHFMPNIFTPSSMLQWPTQIPVWTWSTCYSCEEKEEPWSDCRQG